MVSAFELQRFPLFSMKDFKRHIARFGGEIVQHPTLPVYLITGPRSKMHPYLSELDRADAATLHGV